jgi:hypothetical protein
MTENIWDEARLQRYIDNDIQEGLYLEYKESRALSKSGDKPVKITKEVSAMANSDGGIIIYGIDNNIQWSPVDKTTIKKDWLESIINNVRPRVDGIILHSVQLSSEDNHVAYVIEIPQSNTAHQATDKKYYKRHNSLATPMDDYEIRDIMNRNKHPRIELDFEIVIEKRDRNSGAWGGIGRGVPNYIDVFELRIKATNVGNVYAQYVQAFVSIPSAFAQGQGDSLLGSDGDLIQPTNRERDGIPHYRFSVDNSVKDILSGSPINPSYIKRYEPILPKLSRRFQSEYLNRDFENLNIDEFIIEWETYADNASPNMGLTTLCARIGETTSLQSLV